MPCWKAMDCWGLYRVNSVKLGTMLDRIPFPVWFQLQVDQIRNCIWFGRQKVRQQLLFSKGHSSPRWWQTPKAKWIIAPHPALLPNYWSDWPTAALAHYLGIDMEARAPPDILTSFPFAVPLQELDTLGFSDLLHMPLIFQLPFWNLCFHRSFHNCVRPNFL